jgi:hypothetical protein
MTCRDLAIWKTLRVGELFRENDRLAREERELREAAEAAELFQTGDEDSGDESSNRTSWELEESLSGDGNSLADGLLDNDNESTGDLADDREVSDNEEGQGWDFDDDSVFLSSEF